MRKELAAPLSDHVHIALSDHLSFAIERIQNGLLVQNKLLHEIKALYKKNTRSACGRSDM